MNIATLTTLLLMHTAQQMNQDSGDLAALPVRLLVEALSCLEYPVDRA